MLPTYFYNPILYPLSNTSYIQLYLLILPGYHTRFTKQCMFFYNYFYNPFHYETLFDLFLMTLFMIKHLLLYLHYKLSLFILTSLSIINTPRNTASVNLFSLITSSSFTKHYLYIYFLSLYISTTKHYLFLLKFQTLL